MTSRVTPKQCTLRAVVGEREACPGAACAFWEDAPTPGCTVERLRIPVEIPELARHLLELRLIVEQLQAAAEREDARRRFAALLNLNRE